MLRFKVSMVRGAVAEFADRGDAIAFAKVKSRDDRNITYWVSEQWRDSSLIAFAYNGCMEDKE